MQTLHSASTTLQAKFDRLAPRLPVEILEILINSIMSLPNKDDTQRALYTLIFTCGWLSDIALDELWGRFQHSMVPLIKLFSTSMTQEASVRNFN